MENYIVYIVVAIIAYWVGKHMATIGITLKIGRDPDYFIKMLTKVKEIKVEIEENGMPEEAIPMQKVEIDGQIYLYDKITGNFLAQGGNLMQAALLAAARFPSKRFWHPELQQDAQKV